MANDADLSLAEHVDAICDQFEREFRAGRPSAIESLIADAQEPKRTALLKALVALDVELRQKRGDLPQTSDYAARFPHHKAAVEEAFADARSILSSVKVNAVETSKGPAASRAGAAAAGADIEHLGRFEILSVLGEGAFGTVYRARDPQLDREVAIKVPKAGTQSSEERERFLREARAAAGLHHAHICPVHEVGTIDGRDYIVMAFIEGKPLSAVIKSPTHFADKQIAMVVRKIALALQEAHEKGIIHRDLKPANVMINRKGEPVIMDFGLARRENSGDAQISQSGQIMGTPAYMSPEQARGDGKAVGPAADIHSLGVILYELLSGRRPYEGTITEVIGRILHVNPDPPSKHRADVDPRLEQICLKAIAKKPADRYASMKELATVLGEFIKEPAKPVATDTKPPTQTMAASPGEVMDKQRNIQQFIQQGELPAALEALAGLASNADPQLASWAKGQSAKVKADIKKWQEQLPSLTALGHKLIRKCDYGEAKNILSQIPVSLRPKEIQEAIQEAEEKQEECDLLQVEIEAALRKERPKELSSLVKRFLQLKSGHKEMQKLADDIKQYGAERAIKIRKGQWRGVIDAGLNWKWIAAAACGFAALFAVVYLAVIVFLTREGAVVVEVHDPSIVVSFANEEITVDNSGKKYTLKPTEKKTLKVVVDELEIESATQEITVAKNKTKLITAKLLPDKRLEMVIDGETKTFGTAGSGDGSVADSKGVAPPPAIAPFDAAQAKAHQEAWARYLGVPVEYTNSIGMKFRLIPPGEFMMGSTSEEIEAALKVMGEDSAWKVRILSEAPRHKVVLTQPIYLGVTEVTQAQYERVMEANPSHFSASGPAKVVVAGLQTQNHPVETVNWNDAVEFCIKLSQLEQLKPSYSRSGETNAPQDGTGYRLPTEAEWEFSCRAGTTTRYWSGDENSDLNQSGWLDANSGGRTHAVGELKQNPFGLFDVHGNVWEWVNDCWDPKFYEQFAETAAKNPSSPFSANAERVIRGGSWSIDATRCRSSGHFAHDASPRNENLGFRVSLPLSAVKQGSPQQLARPRRVEVKELNLTGYDTLPWLSTDGLTIYWEGENPKGPRTVEEGPWVYSARRPDANSPFAGVKSLFPARHPTLTGDELEMVFIRGRQGAGSLRVAKRNSKNEDFVPGGQIPELLDQTNPKSPMLNKEGLVLVFQRGRDEDKSVEFVVSTRQDRGSPWSKPTPLPISPDPTWTEPLTWPFLSRDGLTLWYCYGGGKAPEIRKATRSALGTPFGNHQPVIVEGTPLIGRAPRYVAATGELFYSPNLTQQQNDWALWVVKDYASVKTALPSVGSPQIPADAVTFAGNAYKFFPERLSWTDAKRRCEQMGGNLVVVDAKEENDFLVQLCAGKFPNSDKQGGPTIWLGATDAAKEGEWKTVYGTPLTYTNWYKTGNQPNNGGQKGGENYATLLLADWPRINEKAGGWSDQPDMPTAQDVYFVCEWIPANANSAVAGWTELFNGKNLAGWEPDPDRPGRWQVEDGQLQATQGHSFLRTVRSDFADFRLRAEVALSAKSDFKICLRSTDQGTMQCNLRLESQNGSLFYWKSDNDWEPIARGNQSTVAPDAFFPLEISAIGPRVTVAINGVVVTDWTDKNHRMADSGRIELRSHIANAPVRVRNLQVQEIRPESDVGWTDLFNGKDLSNWIAVDGQPAGWKVENGYMEIRPGSKSLMTREKYPLDFELHVEYWLPKELNKKDQARANSGVYLHGRHEIQICDGFENSISNPMTACGALFNQITPTTNVCLPPETWQTYDITYHSPRVNAQKQVTTPGRLTVVHNGTKVIDNATFSRIGTQGQENNDVGQPGPIMLQDHGSPVRFRNIRLRPLGSTAITATPVNADEWTDLFNGNDLTGWKSVGTPTWSWSENRLVGKPAAGGGVGFLMTEVDYDDFELQLEFKANAGFGSGLFLRTDPNGEISGKGCLEVQMVDDDAFKTVPANATGSVFNIFPRKVTPPLKRGDWNTLRVRLNQRHIEVWVNDVQTVDADLDSARDKFASVPGLTRKTGRIALQQNQKADVEFRNVRFRTIGATTAAAGWQPLFPGDDISVWQFSQSLWSMSNGELTGRPSSGEGNVFLMSPRAYRDFELRFQVKAPGQNINSGVQIRSSIADRKKGTARGPQADIGNRQGDFWGGLYGEKMSGWLIRPQRVPAIKRDDFNDYYIRCVGKHVLIRVNEVITVDGDVSEMAAEGLLGFQIHAGNKDNVVFRNIEIRELTGGDQAAASIPADAQSFNEHAYKFFAENVSWKVAKANCAALGGHLIVVENAAENALAATLVSAANWEDAWIGATDEAKEGDWRTIKGDRLPFTNWHTGQPNNKPPGEHFALMSNKKIAEGTIGWKWSDQPNDSTQHRPGYLCEWDVVTTIGSAKSDRAVAEYLISLGAIVRLHGRLEGYEQKDRPTLPEGDLKISEVGFFNGISIPLEAFRNMAGLEELFSVNLHSCRFPPQALDHLAQCPGLNVLDVPDCKLSDDDLRAALGNTALRRIAINGNPVGSATFQRLTQNPKIHLLNLHLTGLSDDDLQHLCSALELTELHLNGNRLTSAAVKMLEAEQSLKDLYLEVGDQITREALLEFQRARPDCKVHADLTETSWTDLFNGKDLTGWKPVALKSTQDPDRQWWAARPQEGILESLGEDHLDLQTDQTYRNFTLKFDWRFTPGGKSIPNGSGVIVRARGLTTEGPVAGFDPKGIEIDFRTNNTNSRGPNLGTGCFIAYGTSLENASGKADGVQNRHLDRLKDPVMAASDAWNTCEITCDGDRITVWINGAKVNEAWGAEDVAGNVCLRNQKSAVQFRNIRISETPGETAAKADGWQDLFNGKDLTGWQTNGVAEGWAVKNGEIVTEPLADKPNMGWLMTEKGYDDFELQLEFMTSERTDSGVAFRCDPNETSGAGHAEIQIVDEQDPELVRKMDEGPHRRTGALAGHSSLRTLPKLERGVWHQLKLEANGRQLKVTIDGVATVETNLNDHVEAAQKVNRKGIWQPSGSIGLAKLGQSPVRFRNIRIRELH